MLSQKESLSLNFAPLITLKHYIEVTCSFPTTLKILKSRNLSCFSASYKFYSHLHITCPVEGKLANTEDNLFVKLCIKT